MLSRIGSIIASGLLCTTLATGAVQAVQAPQAPQDGDSITTMAQARRWAYMDLKTAPEEQKEIIEKSREYIIFHTTDGWMADGWGGEVVDGKTGETLEVLPQFHDLFPADWEIPAGDKLP